MKPLLNSATAMCVIAVAATLSGQGAGSTGKSLTLEATVERVCLQVEADPAPPTCIPKSVLAATFVGYKDNDPSPLATAQWQILSLRDERDALSKQVSDLQRAVLLASVKQAAPIGMTFDGGTGKYAPLVEAKPAPKKGGQ
jgi:hypothetical protein